MNTTQTNNNNFSFFQNRDMYLAKKVSIIIPAKNEEGNIQLLVERIDNALTPLNIWYEIIFIDDHSTDNTRRIIQALSYLYQVSLHIKKGVPGKAQAIIEGFSYAKYDIICMIDADLQYPPEAIPSMLQKLIKGADIVVANRDEKQLSFSRKIISKTFLHIFGKMLHGFSCDVQSGLKIFKKEIITRIALNPTPWTFDLEFLIKAQQAGYTITSEKITFSQRHTGKSKVGILKTSFEIGISAIKQKLTPSEIIPFDLVTAFKRGSGFHYKGNEFVTYTNLDHSETAVFQLTRSQKACLAILCGIIAAGFLINWHTTFITFLAIIVTLYFFDLMFNLLLIYKSFSRNSEIHIANTLVQHTKIEWPIYTILCPLYKEGDVIGQFVEAISRLDYPKGKLQVILLLEEDDTITIQKAQNFGLPSFFEIAILPHSFPKTKPKAINYGLKHAKGEYTVVFDAEDVPDVDQLKKVVLAFKQSERNVVCMQAKLNFYNPHQNLLTKVFTAEYSLWFDVILTGLQAIGAPIPLGGTSNHFRTSDLRQLKGWDAFNVTEDCDLGIRLAKKGFYTAIVNSTTLEEANSDVLNWFRQRGRWIKGYIQTYLVHMRNPFVFLKLPNKSHAITFQLVVGGKIFSMLINPFMWIITFAYFLFREHVATFIESFFPAPILYMGTFSLVFGNFLYLYYYMIGAARRKHFNIIKYAFLVPFYWLGMSITAWFALYKIIKEPYYWAKTKHGLHLQPEKKQTTPLQKESQLLPRVPKISISL